MTILKPNRFNPLYLDHFISLPNCCSNCILQNIIYWILIILSITVLYFEWLLSLTIVQITLNIICEIMRSFSILLLPVYFRYLKPKFKKLLENKSFRRNKNYGMRRNTSDIISYDTRLGGRVSYIFEFY